MKTTFKKIEANLQRLVEGTIARFIPQSLHKLNILTKLVEAMHSGVQLGVSGELIAPNLYYIAINSPEIANSINHKVLLDNLSSFLAENGQESGYKFPTYPVVRFEFVQFLAPGEFSVKAYNSLAEISPTEGVSVETTGLAIQKPVNAYFIIDGTDIYHLSSVLINIGRRPDNQLVIPDPSVSRLHAQLRLKDGRYIVFDLESASGTKVNGKPIHQHELQSGDVLMVGKIPLVFVQEEEDDLVD
jgi:hypothetical protein